MIQGALAVYYRELLVLKYRLNRLMPSWAVSPLLYLIAFGYAMGNHVIVDGRPYMAFLIPGLVAMSSMTQAFAISSEINIARFYWPVFEEIQSAPINDVSYVTGTVMAGMTRALLSVCVILVMGYVFGIGLSLNLWFWLAVLLNSFVFASLAVGLAMLVKSHSDQNLLTSFVITPMAFLGGTFFPLDSFPVWAKTIISCLPIAHAVKTIRSAAFAETPSLFSLVVLALTGTIIFYMSVRCVKQARD